jgi:hypothetical protein
MTFSLLVSCVVDEISLADAIPLGKLCFVVSGRGVQSSLGL